MKILWPGRGTALGWDLVCHGYNITAGWPVRKSYLKERTSAFSSAVYRFAEHALFAIPMIRRLSLGRFVPLADQVLLENSGYGMP